jgi:HipA-like protein
MQRLRADIQETVKTPSDVRAAFVLYLGELPIGTLTLNDGSWEFSYSSQFRAQSDVQPLVDFPDIDKHYVAQSLWPFFMARIPSVAQPRIIETIAREGLDGESDVELLKRFGRQAVSNPFVLKPT